MLRLSVKRVTMAEKITRFGISIEPDLIKKFDTSIKKEGYTNRSEAIRDLIRKDLIAEKTKTRMKKQLELLQCYMTIILEI